MPLITHIASKNMIILILYYYNSIVSIFNSLVESRVAGSISVQWKQKSPFPHFNQWWEVHCYQVDVSSIDYIWFMLRNGNEIGEAIADESKLFQHLLLNFIHRTYSSYSCWFIIILNWVFIYIRHYLICWVYYICRFI